MKRARPVVAALVLASLVVAALPFAPAQAAPSGLIARGPISISSLSNFTLENGVAGGSGSETDRFPLMVPVRPDPPSTCDVCPTAPPDSQPPLELLRSALIGLLALIALSAVWVWLARVRTGRPPKEPPKT